MEDKNILGEDENLHSKQSGENQDEKTTFTLEEVEAIKKKMQSDSEKGVQKLINEKKLEEQQRVIYERVLDEVGKVAEDKSYLIDLYENSPEVAKIILGKYYDGQSIEDYKEQIGYEEDYNDPKIRQRKITQEAKKLAERQLISSKKEEFIKKLQMSEDEVKSFEEAFEERTNLKSFNVNDIEKHLEKAYREINDNADFSKLKSQEVVAKTIGTGETKSSGSIEKKPDQLQTEISGFLNKYFN